LKWYQACYTYDNNNIVILGELKDCCVLGFFKGVLLKDTHQILSQPGKNTQSARTLRFTSVKEIEKMEPIIKAYIYEAIEVERAGLKVDFKKSTDFELPIELKDKFKKNAALKTAFNALTPGRQRAYLLYFSAPKQSKTRESRIEKYEKQILNGKGLND
jgi:uncharacterized protein YdeI (YjbR/CyaY-like superfamily)